MQHSSSTMGAFLMRRWPTPAVPSGRCFRDPRQKRCPHPPSSTQESEAVRRCLCLDQAKRKHGPTPCGASWFHGFVITSIQVGDHTLLRMQEGRNTVTYTSLSRPSLTRASPFWDAIPRPNCLHRLLLEDAILWDGCCIPFRSVTAT